MEPTLPRSAVSRRHLKTAAIVLFVGFAVVSAAWEAPPDHRLRFESVGLVATLLCGCFAWSGGAFLHVLAAISVTTMAAFSGWEWFNAPYGRETIWEHRCGLWLCYTIYVWLSVITRLENSAQSGDESDWREGKRAIYDTEGNVKGYIDRD